MHYKSILFLAFTAINLGLQAQDTLYLTDQSRIACTVTELWPRSIEYLPWGDNRNYTRISKDQVLYVRYAGGKTDTITRIKAGQVNTYTDSFASSVQAFETGVEHGYQRYNPTTEAILSGSSWVLLSWSWVVPVAYSAYKVKPRQISDRQFHASNNIYYREGYLKGAGRRRRQASWTAYGITGAVVGGAIIYSTLYW